MLNIIEFLASQIVENKKTLEYIIKQGTICLLYSHKGRDYYIMFNIVLFPVPRPPIKAFIFSEKGIIIPSPL